MSDPIKAYIKAVIENNLHTTSLSEEKLQQFKAFCDNSGDIAALEQELRANIEDLWQAFEIRRPDAIVEGQHFKGTREAEVEQLEEAPEEISISVDDNSIDGNQSNVEQKEETQPEIKSDNTSLTSETPEELHTDNTTEKSALEEFSFESGSALDQLSREIGNSENDMSNEIAEENQELSITEAPDSSGEAEDTSTEATETSEALETAGSDDHLKIEETITPFTDASEIGPAVSMDPANANRTLNEFDRKIQEELSQPFQQQQMNQARFNLTNARVGKKYEFHFDLDQHQIAGISEVHIDGLEEVGLHFDPDTNIIGGTPTTAGDVTLTLFYKIDGETPKEEDEEYFSRELPFIVNPDPRSLWKNIDPPADAKYPKANSDASTSLNNGYRLVSASKRGRSHAHEGTHRDDDYGMRYLNDSGWYLMTVADGAGSAKYSRKGSEIACDVAMNKLASLSTSDDKLQQLLDAYLTNASEDTELPIKKLLYSSLGTAALNAYNAIKAEAEEQDEPVKVYGTTLLMGCCKKFDFGWFVCALWIGDGAIGIYQKGIDPILLGKPDGGEFAGQTRFLTMPDIFEGDDLFNRVRFDIVDDFTAFILMTDGVSDPKFQTDHNLGQGSQWDALWEDMAETVNFDTENEAIDQQLLDWLDFWSPGNHDDRTISILF